MTKVELDRLRSDGQFLRSVIGQDVKLKRSGTSWKGLCPFHREKTPSFTVYDDGQFRCFGCEARGDVFAYLMQTKGISFPEACNEAVASAGIVPKNNNGNGERQRWCPVVPVPAGEPKPTDNQLRCDALHEYHDAEDRLLFYVQRFETQDNEGRVSKRFVPLTYGLLNGRRGWHLRAPAAPRPLYRLNALSHAPPEVTVLLVEGEKAADAAQRIFPNHVAMTWMGGANADSKADFGCLAGRDVILWPHADDPGRSAMRRIAKRLAPALLIVDTEDLPDGYDAADLEAPEAWLDARLRSLQQAWEGPDSCVTDSSVRTQSDADPWPDPVDFLGDGVVTGTPNLREEHLPSAIYPFVVDTAGRMGVDPASVALASLVTIAAVVSDEWRLQVKQHDDDWTEAPRLWGAIIGDPSVLKSPVIRICTKPIDFLEVQARERFESEMHQFERDQEEWRNDGSDPTKKPEQPLLDRYLVEGTTVEALSEVLRVGDQARHRAPTGKVLIRQDEMSERLAGFDRYRAGGRGVAIGAHTCVSTTAADTPSIA
jgi:CHC2-type zinc finger protein/uncharacterized protein DUF3987